MRSPLGPFGRTVESWKTGAAGAGTRRLVFSQTFAGCATSDRSGGSDARADEQDERNGAARTC